MLSIAKIYKILSSQCIFLSHSGFCLHLLFCHIREDIGVKFPCYPQKFNLPVDYYDVENRLKEVKWKKNRTVEDLNREQELLDQARFKYETKKREFVRFLAESSSYATQVMSQLCAFRCFKEKLENEHQPC